MPKQDYIVVKSSLRKSNSVDVDKHSNEFGKKSHAFTVSDAGLAREIEARYGERGEALPGDVIVAPLNKAPDPIHKRTFTVPDMPWLHKEKDENNRQDGELTGSSEAPGGDQPSA